MVASSPQQSNYCWIVAVACFWLNFCLLGVVRSSAVVFVALVEDFTLTRKDAAWPSGIQGFCMCLTGALSGFISQHFSNRSIMMVGACVAALAVSSCSMASNINHIIILYGALQGAGIGIVVPLTHVTLNQHFHKYRALATGVAYSGSAVGSFLLPAMTHCMLKEFNLSGTFLLLGGIMLQSLIGIALLRRPLAQTPSDYRKTSDETSLNTPALTADPEKIRNSNHSVCNFQKNLPRKITGISSCTSKCKAEKELVFVKLKSSLHLTVNILKNPTFLLISAIYAIYFSVSAIFLMVIFDFSLDIHIPEKQGVFLVSTFSFGDLAGRLLCGWIGDLSCIPRKFTVCAYLLAMGGILTIIPWCPTFTAVATLSVMLGILNGGILVNYSAVFTEFMGLEKLPLVIGFSSCLSGITASLRPVVIGYFRDQHQSYGSLFQFLGIIQILITIVWLSQNILRYFKTFFRAFKFT